MTHIANRTHAVNPLTRSTLTVYPVGTWRDEKSRKEVTQSLYFYQAGADRYAVTVWRKTKVEKSAHPHYLHQKW